MEVTETVLIAKPNQQYAFEMRHDTFETETDIRFISSGQRTEMIQTVQFSPKGFFYETAHANGERSNEKANGKRVTQV